MITRDKIPYKTLLVLILLLGAGFRSFNLMHGASHHPDERHIVMTVESLSLKDPNPDSFAYGSLPFYLLWGVSEGLATIWPYAASYDGLFLVGRTISALFGLLAVFCIYRISIKLYQSEMLALLAAAFLSFNVFHIQLSRFATVDNMLATLCLLALMAFLRIAQVGDWKSYIYSGVILGLCIATKISALTLGFPLLAAIIINNYKSSKFHEASFFLKLQCLALLMIVTCVAVEPYAILDYQKFLHDNKEQMDMASGKWRPPYTIQYAHTTKFLYPLKQMLHYTMGIPLACIVFCAVLWGSFKRGKLKEEVIFYSWIWPVFFAMGSYMVKYPRYFLPLYPLLFMFAAKFLLHLLSKAESKIVKRWVIAGIFVVVGWSLFYATCFMRIYAYEHVYTLASKWIYKNIPRGSSILGVNWDDKLPLHLPGHSPEQYRTFGDEWDVPTYDLPDTTAKWDSISKKLAKADYIIFPTQRQPGSIPRIPDEFPLSTNFFQLLFADQLGYKLIQSIKIRPGMLGFEFNDDLSDESFTVYDHPKVLIFQNVEKLEAQQIMQQIQNPLEHERLTSLEAILLRNSGDTQYYGELVKPTLLQLIIWIVLLELISIGLSPFVVLYFPLLRDKGYALSKIISLVILSYACWLLTYLGVVHLRSFTAWLILIVLLYVSDLLRGRYYNSWWDYIKSIKHFRTVEMLFLGSLFFFVVLRAFTPEIYWGEKPMDFTFLNYFTRLETIPPQDPWASGQRMNYYYFGTFIFALLHKLSAIDSAVGYNLSIASLAALIITTAYSLFCSLFSRRAFIILSSIILFLMSNLEVLKLALIDKKEINFDLFWASTRLFTSPGITEYPLWSILFADLHAHLVAIPITLAVITLSLGLLKRNIRHSGQVHRILLALCLGVLFAINTWDFISFTLFVFVILLLRSINFKASFLRWLKVAVSDVVSFFTLVFVITFPLIVASGAGVEAHIGWVTAPEFDQLQFILRHLGQWLIWIFIGLILLVSRSLFKKAKARRLIIKEELLFADPFLEAAVLTDINVIDKAKARKISIDIKALCFALSFAILPLMLGCVRFIAGIVYERWSIEIKDIPWSILALASANMFLGAYVSFRRRASLSLQLTGACLICSGILMSFCELVFLMDHMNTIFKFYNAIWSFLGVASLILAAYSMFFFIRWFETVDEKRFVGAVVLVILVSVSGIGLAGSLVNIYTMALDKRIDGGPRPSLDGMAYLDAKDANEAALIHWIRSNITGNPVVVEAQGQSYGAFTRISMNTGLSTVLGWEYHVMQRGTSEEEVKRRARDIKGIYTNPSAQASYDLLRKYNVDYIVVSGLERETYPRNGLIKFEQNPDLFKVVFKQGQSSLLQIQNPAKTTSMRKGE